MKHIPHVSQADMDTGEIFAHAQAYLEREGIGLDSPHYGVLAAAYMRTFTETVKWRIADDPNYDRRDVL
jgi:hypothetical protein